MKNKAERTKDALVEGAMRIIVKQGFEGTSFTEIVKATGINRALISYHFGGKEDLIVSVTNYVIGRGQQITQELLQKRTETDLIERYVRVTFDWVRNDPAHMSYLILAMQRGSYDEEIRKIVDQTFQTARNGIMQMLLNQPSLDERQRRMLAVEIHSTLLGHIMNMLFAGMEHLDQFEERAVAATRALVEMRIH